MRIVEALSADRITLHVAVADREAALSALAFSYASGEKPLSGPRVHAAFTERERIASTNLGCGVAIPHARMPGLGEPRLAIGTVCSGVEYDAANDGESEAEPVRILIGLLSDANRPRDHLETLARLVRILERPGVRARLTDAKSPQDVIETLTTAECQVELVRAA